MTADETQESRAHEWLQRATRECADEWMARGQMHIPPDDTSHDDDLAFWRAVDDRAEELARRETRDASA